MMKIRRKDFEFLKAESESWVEQWDVITPEQADKILGLYEVKDYSLKKILLTAGGILLGLAVVSFIAAHWHELGKFFRVCVISAGYIASLCAYYFTGRSQTRGGRAFLLLATLIFGAGIYLITRMYNIKLSFAEVLGWWLVQIILTGIIACDSWQVYFAQAVSLVYLNWINAIDIFALEFMSTSRLPLSEFFFPIEAFILLGALWIVARRIDDRTAVNVNMLLTLLVISSRMSLCFGGTWTLILLAIAGGAMSFSKFGDAEILGLLLMGLCGLVLTWSEVWRGSLAEYGSVLAVASAVITACVMLVNIWRGHSAAGITFCVLLVVRYFFDHLFGYIPKAWGFGIAGAAFIIAGIYSGRKTKSKEPEPEAEVTE